MAKSKKGRPRRLSEIMVWIISALVIISMAVGFVIMVLGPPEPTEVPVQVTPVLEDIENMVDGEGIIVLTAEP